VVTILYCFSYDLYISNVLINLQFRLLGSIGVKDITHGCSEACKLYIY
jgi:hypothetical protein